MGSVGKGQPPHHERTVEHHPDGRSDCVAIRVTTAVLAANRGHVSLTWELQRRRSSESRPDPAARGDCPGWGRRARRRPSQRAASEDTVNKLR